MSWWIRTACGEPGLVGRTRRCRQRWRRSSGWGWRQPATMATYQHPQLCSHSIPCKIPTTLPSPVPVPWGSVRLKEKYSASLSCVLWSRHGRRGPWHNIQTSLGPYDNFRGVFKTSGREGLFGRWNSDWSTVATRIIRLLTIYNSCRTTTQSYSAWSGGVMCSRRLLWHVTQPSLPLWTWHPTSNVEV